MNSSSATPLRFYGSTLSCLQSVVGTLAHIFCACTYFPDDCALLRDPHPIVSFGVPRGARGRRSRDFVNWKRGTNECYCAFETMQFYSIFRCFHAIIPSCLPVWLLLRPRDYVNSHQPNAVMVAGFDACHPHQWTQVGGGRHPRQRHLQSGHR